MNCIVVNGTAAKVYDDLYTEPGLGDENGLFDLT